ncbi:MAG: SDR family oxidoreductase [Chloroflexota bacterium]
MPRRFLVIGADGLVGRHVAGALPAADVLRTSRRGIAGEPTLDITDSDAVRRVIREARPDVIVLAAADAYVERCEREPAKTRRVNVDAARVVAASAKEREALLVVFSSEYVFDGAAGPYSEADERRPINEYGRQKVALEDIALDTGRALICRTSGVFGMDQKRRNFVHQLVERLRAGQTFDVPSDQLVTPTFAPALAGAVVELARSGSTGPYHVAGPQIMSRVDFAQAVAKAFGLDASLLRPRETRELSLAAPRPKRAGLDTRKVSAALGHPLTAPIDGLRELAGSESAQAH